MVELQDALLANADRLLTAALAVLDLGTVGLARSLAILAMEESGKAIALHERRVEMAYAPEGEPFVNARLENLWASHQEKLKLVHTFLAEERYWFGTEPADPERNLAYLGTIKRWALRHDRLKQRGFYVDIDGAGGVLEPTGVSDRESLIDVINHVHQIGWQLRLGEHIEAKQQAEEARGVPPRTEAEIEKMRDIFSRLPGRAADEELYDSMRQGREGRKLNNDDYRLHLPEPGSNPFENLGKPGYEAETRELRRLAEELDRLESQ
ncbi:AbiV family abortive infection protein [Micromonospora sp. CP22]|nr:AbiV family abortive infection protein [Micromonospora sp. CP22]